MKVRQGFVSNSSSSSFVIAQRVATSLITTAKVALDMIEVIEKDYQAWAQQSNEHYGSKWYPLAKEWLEQNQEYDGPIVIPWSCNYDTWIVRLNGQITVDTCNNHRWWDHLKYISEEGYDEDRVYEDWRPQTEDTEFMDLTTLQFVKRSEYKSLWARDREEKERIKNIDRRKVRFII